MKFGNQKSEIVKDRVEMDLSIYPENLNQQLMDQALVYKKYSDLDAEARKAHRDAESYLKVVESTAHIRYSRENPKMKVKDLESLVTLDAQVQQVRAKVSELEEQADKIRGALKAAYQRHDMLKELSYNKRKEFVD